MQVIPHPEECIESIQQQQRVAFVNVRVGIEELGLQQFLGLAVLPFFIWLVFAPILLKTANGQSA